MMIYSELKDSSIHHLNYHFALLRESELVLKCYDTEKCQDCLFLGKRKGNERICVLIGSMLYELGYQTQLLVKDFQIPTICIRSGLEVIQAKIYCKKILGEIL